MPVKFAAAATVAVALAALTASALAVSPKASASSTAGPGKCVAADVSGGISFKDVSGNTAEATVTVRNTSKEACTIHGYPGFGFLNGADQLVTQSKTVRATGVPVSAFTVKPGGYGYTSVDWKLCGTGGAQGNGGELEAGVVLTLPNDTKQVALTIKGQDTRQYVWRTCSFTFIQAEPFRTGKG
jgi:hypothetical protein